MFKILLIFLFTACTTVGLGQIVLTDTVLGTPQTKYVFILEDKAHEVDLEEVLEMENDAFYQPLRANPIVQFSTSRFWIKFSITNQSNYSDFILETARPITDTVIFYELEEGKVKKKFLNGDDYPYYGKEIAHRKNLFPIQLEKGEEKEFFVQIGSGGEGVILPVIVHEKMAFFEQDFKDQFKNGFYYGVIALVIVIYFFFFLLLNDITFLYYIVYVFFQGLLQFSLDGYSFHHFFPSGGYMANRFPPLTGALAIIFMLVYVNKYLNLKVQLPRFRKTFFIAGFLMGIGLIFTFLPGRLHEISYPVVNAISLLSIVLAVSSIMYLRMTRKKVDIYFTIAFLALITGAIIFILGNFNIIENSLLSLNALKISSVVEVVILSISMSFKYRELQQDKEEAQARALKNLEEKNALMDQSNVLLEQQVRERTKEIEWQKEELARSNDEIVSSIKYAKRIQEAILPADHHVKTLLPNSFVLYAPKDVVSGDFYFVESTQTSDNDTRTYTIFAAVDCTGHGVPGAFLSIVGNNLLSQSLSEKSVNSPAEALAYLNSGLHRKLRQEVEGQAVRDGMDIALCALNHDHTELMFAGAKNPLYLLRKKELEGPEGYEPKEETEICVLYQINGDKHPIGNSAEKGLLPYTNHTLKLLPGDRLYIFTDGYADQFGGERKKKFNYRRFRELLMAVYALPMEEQKAVLQEQFETWKNGEAQVDDVLVIGLAIEAKNT